MSIGKEKRKNECPHCGCDRLERVNNSLVCPRCGTTVLDNVCLSKEEEIYSYEDYVKESKHARAEVKTSTKTQWDNFRRAIHDIGDLTNQLHLPPFIKNTAIDYYKQIMSKKPPRRDTLQSLIPALVYLACRKSGIPLAFKRLVSICDVEEAKVSDNYFKVREQLEIKVKPQSLRQLVLRFSKEIGLGDDIVTYTDRLVNKIEEHHVGLGKDPVGVAAAIVYLAAKRVNRDVTRYDMTKLASVSEVTIQDRIESIRSMF